MKDLFELLHLHPGSFPSPTFETFYDQVKPYTIHKVIFHFLISKALIDHLCESIEEISEDDSFGVDLELTEEEALLNISSVSDTTIMVELYREEALEWLSPEVEDLYGKSIESLMEEARTTPQ